MSNIEIVEPDPPEVLDLVKYEKARRALSDLGHTGISDFVCTLGDGETSDIIKKVNEYLASMVALLHLAMTDNSIHKDVESLCKLSNAIAKQTALISSNLMAKYKMDRDEEVDFNNPKIQRGMAFLFEMFLDTLRDLKLDENLILNIVNHLSTKAVGFEDRLNHALKNVSSTMLDSIHNPLIPEVEKSMGKSPKS